MAERGHGCSYGRARRGTTFRIRRLPSTSKVSMHCRVRFTAAVCGRQVRLPRASLGSFRVGRRPRPLRRRADVLAVADDDMPVLAPVIEVALVVVQNVQLGREVE